HADHARGMRRGRDLRQQARLDVLPRAQHVDRRRACRRDRVLPLDDEETELVAPALVVQLSHELQAFVVARGDDRYRPQSSQAPWKSKIASRSEAPSGKLSTSSAKPSSSGARPVVMKT